MTHTRYWAATLATAVCGGFIVVVRFAFDSSTTPWIVFGVAIGATVFSLGAFLVALRRDSQAFSGLSATNALIGAWTIIAMLTLNKPAAGWLAFACGLALLIVSLRALALHETSIERVVYALESAMPGQAQESPPTDASAPRALEILSHLHVQVHVSMRSWLSWLANTAIAVAGGFIVVMTFAMTRPGTNHVSPRWIAFGIAIAAATVALASLLDRGLLRRNGKTADWTAEGRPGLLAIAALNLAAAVALIVTMIVYTGDTARWLAFALGCAMVGVSLLGLAVHEITTERVRHELEVAEPLVPDRTGPPRGLPARAA